MNSIISTIDTIRKDLFKSKTKIRDHYFKQYFLDSILTKHPFMLVNQKHNHSDSFKKYLYNDRLPEYTFMDVTNERKFFVDTYYKPSWLGSYPHQYIDSLDKDRLLLLKKYDSIRRLFIAITIGGDRISGKPLECFLVPVRYLEHEHKYFRKQLQCFTIHNVNISFDEFTSPLSSKDLWKRFNWKYNYTPKTDTL